MVKPGAGIPRQASEFSIDSKVLWRSFAKIVPMNCMRQVRSGQLAPRNRYDGMQAKKPILKLHSYVLLG
jgi:hypothetical protein